MMKNIFRALALLLTVTVITACVSDGSWPPSGDTYRRGEASAPSGLEPASPWRVGAPQPQPTPDGTGQSTPTPTDEAASTQSEEKLSSFFPSLSRDNTNTNQPIATKGKTNVAILLPLSGPEKAIGRAMLEAAQLATLDFANNNFALLPFDTKGTPSGAVNAFEQAVYNGAQLILGPVFAQEVSAISSRAQRQGIPVVAFTNDTAAAEEGVYVMGFTTGPQVSRLISYAADQGIRKFAYLGPETPYGKSVLDSVRRNINAYDGDLIKTELYPADTKDFAEVIKRLGDFDKRKQNLEEEKEKVRTDMAMGKLSQAAGKKQLEALDKKDSSGDVDFEALIIADTGSRLGNLAPLLPYYDINPRKVKLLGLSQWENVAFIKTEPAFNRGWFVAPQPKGRDDFNAKFKEAWGYTPPRVASIAYDAASLAAGLARMSGGRPDFSYSALTNRGGFQGIDGIFRLTGDGITERGLAIMEVRDRMITVRDPAPTRF